ncbi:MAG: hypothetical protein GEV11_21495 [Streptosporangiales bacterium]|nr:hypothetical protein [Streptosporangiales bacterium]
MFFGWGVLVAIKLNNTVFTEAAMEASDAPRPVASAGYNVVRWIGGALAPFIVTKIDENIAPSLPYYLAAACCAIGMGILIVRRRHLETLGAVDVDHRVRDAEPLPA